MNFQQLLLENHKIDGAKFLEITEADLQKIGVLNVVARAKLLNRTINSSFYLKNYHRSIRSVPI